MFESTGLRSEQHSVADLLAAVAEDRRLRRFHVYDLAVNVPLAIVVALVLWNATDLPQFVAIAAGAVSYGVLTVLGLVIYDRLVPPPIRRDFSDYLLLALEVARESIKPIGAALIAALFGLMFS